jgi:MFS family permease
MDASQDGASVTAAPTGSARSFQAPTTPVGARFVVPFAITYFGLWMTLLTPTVIALSVYLASVVPEGERSGALALVLGVAGIVGVVVNPLVGKLSDRTTSRLGMRKPWIVAGVVITIMGLVVIASSTTVVLILLGWCIATVGLNATIAALTSLLPDHVPHHQRGRVSGILGMGIPVGAVGGAGLAQAFTTRPFLMFLAPAVVLVIGVGLLLPAYTDRRLRPEDARQLPGFDWREFLSSYWVSPRRHPDFGWTWLSRFLVFMGVSTLVTFQAFYLIAQLQVPLERVATLVAVSTAVHYVFVFAASPVGGWLSDRLDRRKVFITVAAGLYAVGLAVVAFAQSFAVFLVGMAITGIGEGAYLAVDLALVTDVLPNPDEAAKEMAVFNVATALPPAVAPAVAPLFLAIPVLGTGTGGNYVALFIAAALFAALGALAIRPVRSAR